MPLVEASCSPWRQSKYAVHNALLSGRTSACFALPPTARTGYALFRRAISADGRWRHRDATDAELLGAWHSHVRQCRVVGLVEEASLVLVQVVAVDDMTPCNLSMMVATDKTKSAQMAEYDTSIVQDEDLIVVSPRLKIDDTDALKYIHIDQESVKNVQDSMEITSRPTGALVCMCVRPCMHRKHEALVSYVCGDILGGVQFESAKESTCNIDQFQFGPEINEFTCIHGRLVMYAANHKQGVIKIYKFHLVRPPDKEAYS